MHGENVRAVGDASLRGLTVLKVFFDLQPRGKLLPQIIPEFGAILDVPWTTALSHESPRLLTADERSYLQLQHEAKLLSITSGDESTGTTNTMAKVGVYRTEDELEALKLQRPFDSSTSVSDDAKRAMYWLLTYGPDEVKRNREQLLEHYEKLKEDLSMTNRYYTLQKTLWRCRRRWSRPHWPSDQRSPAYGPGGRNWTIWKPCCGAHDGQCATH